MKWNKKGASVDNFFIMITFFGLAIFFLAVMLFWNGISDATNDLWTSSEQGPQIRENAQAAVDTFDFILVLVYFGLHLGILAMSFLLRSHPVIYVAAILLIAILALVAAPISNAYVDLTIDTEVAVISGDIPMTNYILQNLPKFEIIWGLITAIVLFGFARYEGII
jgi:hypothetical protein